MHVHSETVARVLAQAGLPRIGVGDPALEDELDIGATQPEIAQMLLDAETRRLPVQPLGRPREVTRNGSFVKSAREQLPPGFVVRDLQIVLARGDLAGAFDGLERLIDRLVTVRR